MSTNIEAKAYGPDCSESEKIMLKSRVSYLSHDIIYYNAPPIISDFQLNVMWSKVKELATKKQSSYLLVDITGTEIPTANQRVILKNYITDALEYIDYIAVYTGKNKFLNFTAKFILGAKGYERISLHTTRNQALNDIRRQKDR